MESLEKELSEIKDTFATPAADANDDKEESGIINWKKFTTKIARKAITIGAVLAILCACNGFNTITQYAYRERFYSFDGNGQSTLFAEYAIVIALFAGVLLATQLVDHIGRKVWKNVAHFISMNSSIFSFIK